MDEPDNHPVITPKKCRNCGTGLVGPYCSQCGQAVRDLDRPFRELALEWLGAVAAFDARVLGTLVPLITRPGQLTINYLAGRRARYVHPLKLYFVISLALFFALALSGYGVVYETNNPSQTMTFSWGGVEDDSDQVPPTETEAEATPVVEEPAAVLQIDDERGWIESRLIAIGERYVADPAAFNRLFVNRLAKAVFLLVPIFALLLKLFFPRTVYLHHLVFSLHLHAFAFLVILASIAAKTAWPATEDAGSLVAMVILMPYTFVALRRCYGAGRLRTTMTMIALGLCYLVALVVVMIIAIAATSIGA